METSGKVASAPRRRGESTDSVERRARPDSKRSRNRDANVRFVSWNIAMSGHARLPRQIDFLRDLRCDIVALQEVSPESGQALEACGDFANVWQGLSLRSPRPEETRARQRGCVLLA